MDTSNQQIWDEFDLFDESSITRVETEQLTALLLSANAIGE